MRQLPLEIEIIILNMVYYAKHYEKMESIRDYINNFGNDFIYIQQPLVYIISCCECRKRIKKETGSMEIEKNHNYDICKTCLHTT